MAVMMSFHVPENHPEYLKSVARVSLTHSHLDYSLRMCIKSLLGISIDDALEKTDRWGAGQLRTRIDDLATERFGDGDVLARLQELVDRCEGASARRNRLIHDIVAIDENGVPRLGSIEWHLLPKPEELDALATQLLELAKELNHARLKGWLAQAIAEAKRE